MSRGTRKRKHIDMHIEQYSNYRAFLDACDAREYQWYANHHREEGNSWAGDGYSDARRMFEHGDAAAVDKLTPRTVTQAASIKARKTRDVCGYAPIVPAAIIGLPKTMRRRVKAPTRSKVVTLVIDVTGAAFVNAEEFEKAGRELCAFIRGAELAGYRIGVDVLATFQSDDTEDPATGYACRITIKKPEQPLDIKRVAYPLIHASMLRQLFFDWYERMPNGQYIDSYGHAIRHNNATARADVLAQILKPNEHYCGLLDRDFEQALK